MRFGKVSIVLAALVAGMIACAGPPGWRAYEPSPAGAPTASPTDPMRYEQLIETARREGSVLVIVDLAIPYRPEAELGSPEAIRRQRAEIAAAQEALLASLEGHEVTVSARYEFVPQIALGVDEAALRILIASDLASDIQLNEAEPPAAP
jgi:hypothetical protein